MNEQLICMRSLFLKWFLAFFIFMATSLSSYAQSNVLDRIVEPRLFRVTDEMREYIRSKQFPGVSSSRSEELHHVDLLFEKGMDLSRNEVATALLAISVAVLNRTYFEPTIPLIGRVRIPLPAEDSSDAASRVKKLPRFFFEDSPKDKWGDSAKPIHFFGSAYLTYVSGTRNIPDAIGVWIEEGETAFKLDSLDQRRDVFINRLGQRFGQALSDGRAVLPSDFLRSDYGGR